VLVDYGSASFIMLLHLTTMILCSLKKETTRLRRMRMRRWRRCQKKETMRWRRMRWRWWRRRQMHNLGLLVHGVGAALMIPR
jgi:hypothetical protein